MAAQGSDPSDQPTSWQVCSQAGHHFRPLLWVTRHELYRAGECRLKSMYAQNLSMSLNLDIGSLQMVKMRSYWSRVGCQSSMMGVFIRRGGFRSRNTEETQGEKTT